MITNTATTRALCAAGLGLLIAGCAPGKTEFARENAGEVDHETHEFITQQLIEESEKLRRQNDQLVASLERRREPAPLPAPEAPRFDPLESVMVTIDAEDASVGQVLRALAEQADMNLLLDPSVAQLGLRTSLHLKEVSAREIFDHVMRAYDLHGEARGSVLVVNRMQERTFNLDFLDTRVDVDFSSGGNVFGANASGGGGGAGGGSGGGGGDLIQGSFSLNGGSGDQTNPYEQLDQMLQSVLGERAGNNGRSGEEQALYSLNRSTGTLFIRAKPSQVRAIHGLVSNYKSVMRRQVLIDAQILDVSLSEEFRYGVDWNILRSRVAGIYGEGGMNLSQSQVNFPPGSSGSLPARTLTLPARSVGGDGRSFGAAYQDGNFSAVVDALQGFGAVRVLSNPSVRARNNTPALMSVGTTARFVSQSSTSVTNPGGGAVTTSANVITDSLFDGIMVGVVPFIDEDGRINLLVNPMQTEVDPESLQLRDVGGDNRVTLPLINFKGLTTSLSLNDGDTVIIGGLIDENRSSQGDGVPGLARVPLFRNFFSSRNYSNTGRELIIVLRVRIL